jgi:glutamine amidotransferase
MSLLFGYMANEPERVRCALHAARGTLQVPTDALVESWGLGFYQGGEVLLQRRPRAAPGSIDFYAQLRELRTDAAIGEVRSRLPDAPAAPPSDEGGQPYRFRSWLFASQGGWSGFPEARAALLERVPEFLRRNLRGTSASEHLFHLFLSFLHDAGKLDDPELTVGPARDALRATLAFADRLAAKSAEGPGPLGMVAMSGRLLLAAWRGRPLSLRRLRGIADCPVCREPGDRGRDGKRVAHEHLRAALVLSREAPLEESGWEALPDASVVTVSHSVEIGVEPL